MICPLMARGEVTGYSMILIGATIQLVRFGARGATVYDAMYVRGRRSVTLQHMNVPVVVHRSVYVCMYVYALHVCVCLACIWHMYVHVSCYSVMPSTYARM